MNIITVVVLRTGQDSHNSSPLNTLKIIKEILFKAFILVLNCNLITLTTKNEHYYPFKLIKYLFLHFI